MPCPWYCCGTTPRGPAAAMPGGPRPALALGLGLGPGAIICFSTSARLLGGATPPVALRLASCFSSSASEPSSGIPDGGADVLAAPAGLACSSSNPVIAPKAVTSRSRSKVPPPSRPPPLALESPDSASSTPSLLSQDVRSLPSPPPWLKSDGSPALAFGSPLGLGFAATSPKVSRSRGSTAVAPNVSKSSSGAGGAGAAPLPPPLPTRPSERSP
mmetsp:Transcript_38813/g.121698  ORF Transcript_38813/g.121698 Transcript_38813/m.121698 type:complete len:215 (-) Transcript_38813:313-957(-)